MGYVSTTTYMHTYYWYPKCNFQYSYLRFYEPICTKLSQFSDTFILMTAVNFHEE